MSEERYTKEQIKKWKEEGSEGLWEDATDLLEASPHMAGVMEDMTIEFLKENNPKLLEIMKRAGLNVDESETKED